MSAGSASVFSIKRTPSASISRTRRSTTSFGSFMFGMPYISRPPGRSARSTTVAACPSRFNRSAAARPAGPLPTTATRLPVRVRGIRGCTQPLAKPVSIR